MTVSNRYIPTESIIFYTCVTFSCFPPKIDNRSLIVVIKSTIVMNQYMKGGVFYFSHSLMTIYLSYKFNYFFFSNRKKIILNTFFEHDKLFDLLRVGAFEHSAVLFRHLENENKILTARHIEVLFVCNGCFFNAISMSLHQTFD